MNRLKGVTDKKFTIGELGLSDSLTAARNLLGWKLVHDSPEGRTAGIIVETEAYHQEDEASHTYKGLTKRNAAMFEKAGTAYIYFTYGMHYCFNVATGKKGEGQGVLIRALEPTEGIDLMKSRRMKDNVNLLTNGPAKLVQAMGITMKYYGHNLLSGNDLYIERGILPSKIQSSPRIGISVAASKPWRFYIDGNPFVSKR